MASHIAFACFIDILQFFNVSLEVLVKFPYVDEWCSFKFTLVSIYDRSCKLKHTETGSQKSVTVRVTDVHNFPSYFCSLSSCSTFSDLYVLTLKIWTMQYSDMHLAETYYRFQIIVCE
jgi:hypothetical protein